MNLGNRMRKISVFTVLSGVTFCMLATSGCDKTPQGEKSTADNQSVEKPTTRMPFDQLFEVNGNNVTPKQVIRVGPTTMTPAVPFESNVMMIDNTPFSQYIGREAEVKKSGDVYEIVKFY